MGTASTKFRKYLQNGDEYAAMQVFQSSPDLQKNLDPNMSYGDAYNHNTPLHFTAKHAMKHLLRTFLNDLGGNPNKKNTKNESSLHTVCQVLQAKSLSTQERRSMCTILILQWQGPVLENGQYEKVDLTAVDERKNTALHHAAISGLKKCVELLVAHGAPLFVENEECMTPCDLAEKAGHLDIALFLESKMVFTESADTVNEADLLINLDFPEAYSGLRSQDLQEAKDQLLVETSDMLHVPLFTAEALLRNNDWSRESLLETWMKDPIECCEKAGVQTPPSALQLAASQQGEMSEDVVTYEYQEESLNSPIRTTPLEAEIMCEICTCVFEPTEEPVPAACDHFFCRACWEKYLSVKIQAGDAHIMCPAYGCSRLVPIDIIEKLVSADMVRRYLQFDIKAFVESNPTIKWCPFPGCGRAVRFPFTETATASVFAIMKTSHAVDCGNGHYFCWECLGEAHAPCCCEKWKLWHQKIAEVKPEELKSTCVETEDAANCLWLITNSKPCPNCKSPIQKNEGCNHMKCSKCKFDFCWVCLEAWKKHSSATGGYFRCNRYEAVHRAEERHGMLISVAELRNKQMQELNRFVHYYTRFRNHENSHRMEEPLLESAKEKMFHFASSMPDLESGSGETETKFVKDSVTELLKARRVLCGSYVYGYYLEDNGYNKTIFEFMQNELEECTEKMAQMVARPYLRTPRAKIMQTTANVKRKRQEFVTAVAKGLIPPETPTNVRRFGRRRFTGLARMDSAEDEQLTQAIAESLRDLDPNDPWVKDSRGLHTNLTAIYDWPEYDSDEDIEMNQALAASILGECARNGCNRLRARNPRTGGLHDYCSFRCSKAAKRGELEEGSVAYTSDYQMELLIALEMSRLQMIQDMERQRQNSENAENVENGENSENVENQQWNEESSSGLTINSIPNSSSWHYESQNINSPEENLDAQNEEIIKLNETLEEIIKHNETRDENSTTNDTSCELIEKQSSFDTDTLDNYFAPSSSNVESCATTVDLPIDKKLLSFKSNSTGLLDQSIDRNNRLTASTGNLVTHLDHEWDRRTALEFLRQPSEWFLTSTASLAITQDDLSECDHHNHRLVASTGNLTTSRCPAYISSNPIFTLRLVSSALDLPESRCWGSASSLGASHVEEGVSGSCSPIRKQTCRLSLRKQPHLLHHWNIFL